VTRRSLEEREQIAWQEYLAACPSWGDHRPDAAAIETAAWRRLKRELVAIKDDRRRAGLEDAYAAAISVDGPIP
jgi:hypothetical protein